MKTVVLNKREYDVDFVNKTKSILTSEFGAEFGETTEVGPVGSQVITVMPFRIAGQGMHLEAETYVGISLTGPSDMVDKIAIRLKN